MSHTHTIEPDSIVIRLNFLQIIILAQLCRDQIVSDRLPSLKAEWLEHLIPVLEVMGSDPTVSGVISGKLKLAAGFIQSTLWRGLAQCFDLDSFGQVI